ncbi:MAG: PAS domain S-box protein, partial [Burkholderiales bacterium]|nr:PAS domain S-box protein [Burkholderiales bacterium]
MASDGAAGDAAQALRRSEERYRSLFASIDDGFCICEILVDERGEPRDYRFVEVNPTFEAHTGLRDAAGRTALELVPGLERHWIDVYAEVARTGRPVRFEQGSDAMRRWFDVNAFRVGDPAERLVGILFKDVSERRRAELDLRESESRFRELADGAPIFVWMADADARLTYVNRTAVDFLGLPPATLGGRGWEAVVHPDDAPRLHAAHAAAVRDRGPYAIEVRYRRAASGAYEWHLVQGVPRRVGGAFAGMMGTAANIHDRKLAEDALRAADRRKDEFLATLAHELRNPLAPLRNGLAVLRLAG